MPEKSQVSVQVARFVQPRVCPVVPRSKANQSGLQLTTETREGVRKINRYWWPPTIAVFVSHTISLWWVGGGYTYLYLQASPSRKGKTNPWAPSLASWFLACNTKTAPGCGCQGTTTGPPGRRRGSSRRGVINRWAVDYITQPTSSSTRDYLPKWITRTTTTSVVVLYGSSSGCSRGAQDMQSPSSVTRTRNWAESVVARERRTVAVCRFVTESRQ